jgi:Cu(I)/Ag(I) efflux system membrane fusion protein/cobalt-zinc-cadmium efflux system membrane fusion protein
MKNLDKMIVVIFTLILILCSSSFAQEKMDSTTNHKNMKMHNMEMKKDSVVREGVINLQKIDKNKDGKVFQDMMDYNVISDKAGKCPLCGMKLKEVSLKNAKEFLIKSGFEVK